MRDKMNKRAFLLAEETLKIVIALICISFLVYFLVSLYITNQNDRDLEMAKASLSHLFEEINSIEDEGVKEIEIYNPDGWVISLWPHKVMKGTYGFRKEVRDIPKSCSNLGWESCLCICKGNYFLNLEGSDCDKSGICLNNKIGLSIEEGVIEIKGSLLQLNAEHKEEKIVVSKK